MVHQKKNFMDYRKIDNMASQSANTRGENLGNRLAPAYSRRTTNRPLPDDMTMDEVLREIEKRKRGLR